MPPQRVLHIMVQKMAPKGGNVRSFVFGPVLKFWVCHPTADQQWTIHTRCARLCTNLCGHPLMLLAAVWTLPYTTVGSIVCILCIARCSASCVNRTLEKQYSLAVGPIYGSVLYQLFRQVVPFLTLTGVVFFTIGRCLNASEGDFPEICSETEENPVHNSFLVSVVQRDHRWAQASNDPQDVRKR